MLTICILLQKIVSIDQEHLHRKITVNGYFMK